MIIAASIVAAIAALLHVYIFALESLWWTRPVARKVFGTTEQEAHDTRQLAFNQGFYNLFLALTVFVGLGFWWAGSALLGAALVLTGLASMALAALVLLLSSRDKASAALKQGVIPLLGIILVVLHLVF